MNPHDPDAKITKLKDGRTRLGHKVEEAVALETAVVAVTAPEELGDPQTLGETVRMAQEEVEAVGSGAQARKVVADKGYHSNGGAGVEGTGIAGVSVGNGSGPAQLEGEEPEVPGAGVRESETDSRPPGTTVTAAAGASWQQRSFVHQAHHGRVAPHLRPGPRQCPEAIADPRVRFQPGTADATSDGDRDAPEFAGPRPDASFFASWGENGPLAQLESALGALLGADRPNSLFGAPRTHQ